MLPSKEKNIFKTGSLSLCLLISVIFFLYIYPQEKKASSPQHEKKLVNLDKSLEKEKHQKVEKSTNIEIQESYLAKPLKTSAISTQENKQFRKLIKASAKKNYLTKRDSKKVLLNI
jgi:hypothetical protein